MPPKKSAAVQKAAGDSGPVLIEGSDPVQTAVAIIDRKVRNLEKRKVLYCTCTGSQIAFYIVESVSIAKCHTYSLYEGIMF